MNNTTEKKVENITILASLPLIVSLLDLLIGNEFLLKIGLISKNNEKNFIIGFIITIFILLGIAFIIRTLRSQKSERNNTFSQIITFLIFITFFGFLWDFVTSIYGFYRLFISGNEINIFTLFFAIILTSISFLITLTIPSLFTGVENPVICTINYSVFLKIIYFIFFIGAFVFDFYTSFIGNANLLNVPIDKLNFVKTIALVFGTFIVSMCQYSFWGYFFIEPKNNKPSYDRQRSYSDDKYDSLLESARYIDYTRLRDLLKAGQWKEADYETSWVMLKAVGREGDNWIRDEELLNFPCTDLRTIDKLWVKYSNGRFGFSVQKQIYLEVGGLPDGEYYYEAWTRFGDRVGWRVQKSWIDYSDVIFDTIAPRGHLPTLYSRGFGRVGWRVGVVTSFLASRLVNCNL